MHDFWVGNRLLSTSSPLKSVPACMHAKSLQSCPTLWDPWTVAHTRLLCPWDSPGQNTGVGCHALLQENQFKSPLFREKLCFHTTWKYPDIITIKHLGRCGSFTYRFYCPCPLGPTSFNKSHRHCVLMTVGAAPSAPAPCPLSTLTTFRIGVGNLLRLPVANKPGTHPWICQPQGLCSGLFSEGQLVYPLPQILTLKS